MLFRYWFTDLFCETSYWHYITLHYNSSTEQLMHELRDRVDLMELWFVFVEDGSCDGRSYDEVCCAWPSPGGTVRAVLGGDCRLLCAVSALSGAALPGAGHTQRQDDVTHQITADRRSDVTTAGCIVGWLLSMSMFWGLLLGTRIYLLNVIHMQEIRKWLCVSIGESWLLDYYGCAFRVIMLIIFIQGSHSHGKPGKLMEFLEW